jgi:hypothetical protein
MFAAAGVAAVDKFELPAGEVWLQPAAVNRQSIAKGKAMTRGIRFIVFS